jgi:hypothetical protein
MTEKGLRGSQSTRTHWTARSKPFSEGPVGLLLGTWIPEQLGGGRPEGRTPDGEIKVRIWHILATRRGSLWAAFDQLRVRQLHCPCGGCLQRRHAVRSEGPDQGQTSAANTCSGALSCGGRSSGMKSKICVGRLPSGGKAMPGSHDPSPG